MRFAKSITHAIQLAGILTAMALCPAARAQSTQLAATPPMGWNSWNHFWSHVTDADIRKAADAMVSTGMRDAGYTYVNIDDTWEGKRDGHGEIHSNERFPDMKALADYVHSKGLKLGIYSSPGPLTCAKYEGSLDHEVQDAKTYAAWGIDYIKYDLCSYRLIIEKEAGTNNDKAYAMEKAAYEKMHQALLATGRPIVFSLCQYGRFSSWKWAPSVGGNLWRTTGDIHDNWKEMSKIGFSQSDIAQYAGPGHWNDPDMLEIGNGGMNTDEYRTHMTLWAILAAPLLAGNDLSQMSAETKQILTNAEVIAVDQDALGKQGTRVLKDGDIEVWSRPLAGGAKAIGIFNRAEEARLVDVDLTRAGVDPSARVRDLWLHYDSKLQGGMFHQLVPKHGSVMLRVTP